MQLTYCSLAERLREPLGFAAQPPNPKQQRRHKNEPSQDKDSQRLDLKRCRANKQHEAREQGEEDQKLCAILLQLALKPHMRCNA